LLHWSFLLSGVEDSDVKSFCGGYSMTRERQWAVVITLLLTGAAVILFLWWIDSAPSELPPPYVIQRALLSAGQRPTPLPLADQPNTTIASKPYRHPSGTFSVKYPDGWQTDEAEDAVLFTAPDDSAHYSVSFRKAAAPASAKDLIRDYVQSGWGDLPKFKLEKVDTNANGNRSSAAFTFEQILLPEKITIRMTGQTLLQTQNGIVFSQTLLFRPETQNRFADLFQSLSGSLIVSPPPIASGAK
jgi:hypothetical protein